MANTAVPVIPTNGLAPAWPNVPDPMVPASIQVTNPWKANIKSKEKPANDARTILGSISCSNLSLQVRPNEFHQDVLMLEFNQNQWRPASDRLQRLSKTLEGSSWRPPREPLAAQTLVPNIASEWNTQNYTYHPIIAHLSSSKIWNWWPWW